MATLPATASIATKLSGSRLTLDLSTVSAPLGRGLVSPEAVAAGNLLLSLDPLVSVLEDPEKACSRCFIVSKAVDDAIGQELLKCTGCGIVRYCSKVVRICITDVNRRVKRRIGRLIIRGNANIYGSIRAPRPF